MSNTDYTLSLKPRHYEFLEQMAEKHNLPDASKALRCLIDFAMSETEHEEVIFQTIRCMDC